MEKVAYLTVEKHPGSSVEKCAYFFRLNEQGKWLYVDGTNRLEESGAKSLRQWFLYVKTKVGRPVFRYKKSAGNAWCYFRCSGCDRYLQATRHYAHGKDIKGVSELAIDCYGLPNGDRGRYLHQDFEDPEAWTLGDTFEQFRNSECWLGVDCKTVAGPFVNNPLPCD